MNKCALLVVVAFSSIFTLAIFHVAVQIATYDGWMLGGYDGWHCVRLPLGADWFVSGEADEAVACVEVWKTGAPIGADSLFGTVCLEKQGPNIWRSF